MTLTSCPRGRKLGTSAGSTCTARMNFRGGACLDHVLPFPIKVGDVSQSQTKPNPIENPCRYPSVDRTSNGTEQNQSQATITPRPGAQAQDDASRSVNPCFEIAVGAVGVRHSAAKQPRQTGTHKEPDQLPRAYGQMGCATL